MSNTESKQKGPRKRKQKEEAPEVLEHKEKVQKGVPKQAEKGRQDTRNENNQRQCLNINTFTLFLVVALAVFAVVLAVCVWQMDGHYKMEIETLKQKVTRMEKTNADELAKLRKEIQGLTSSVNNTATKQDANNINNKIEQPDTKLKTKFKGQ